ncbi:hypothetical protein [Leptospira licerasiae]|uniref:LysM domain-containing protein n=1 Tax=Leptospira licerasiae str. MMD4847 TaxID=1049971 RepID=A0ABP2RG38_9LEPT|nr:hypothetical protein [Leptospira licerasiae]EIE01411.1 hypothetical protein LEP1GSC185_3928 [Leptospira licerasiae serovar Varillal str. VAR 010]EJZ42324.1 hypothetical protein LEP1GSC178_0091 [Leptospira licerasiae str. MMD4847]
MVSLGGITDFASGSFNSVTSNAFSGPLGSTYVPKNSFSLAFYNKKANGDYDHTSKGEPEYYFVNGPLQYSENYKYRRSIEQTFGATVVIDYGPGNHEIRLEGEFHIYHLGLPSKPNSDIPGSSGQGMFQTAVNAGKTFLTNKFTSYYDKIRSQYLALGGGNFRSGLQEFQDFLFFLHYSQYNGKYESNDIQAKQIAGKLSGTINWKKIAIVFRDYDRKRTVEVVVPGSGFTISRSVSDTNTYKYSLTLTVVRELDFENIKSELVRSNFNPSRTISGLMNELENLVNTPLILTGTLLGAAKFIRAFGSSTARLRTSWDRMRDQFDQNGKLARVTFQEGITDLGFRGKKRGFNDEDISSAIDGAYSLSRSREAEFRQNLTKANTEALALNSAIGSMTIPIPDNSSFELESLKPKADFFNWIDNDLYSFVITALEILTEMQAAINYASIDNTFSIKQIQTGETYNSIAQEALGNETLGEALARYNGDSDVKKIERKVIKIPFGYSTNVVSLLSENPSARDLEIAILGTDIKLSENRAIDISPTGDLGIIEGEETLINNTLDIIDIPQGSIPGLPEIGNPIPIGEIPTEEQIQDSIQKLISQISKDPGVKSVRFLNMEQVGDKILFVFRFESVTGGSFVLSV